MANDIPSSSRPITIHVSHNTTYKQTHECTTCSKRTQKNHTHHLHFRPSTGFYFVCYSRSADVSRVTSCGKKPHGLVGSYKTPPTHSLGRTSPPLQTSRFARSRSVLRKILPDCGFGVSWVSREYGRRREDREEESETSGSAG